LDDWLLDRAAGHNRMASTLFPIDPMLVPVPSLEVEIVGSWNGESAKSPDVESYALLLFKSDIAIRVSVTAVLVVAVVVCVLATSTGAVHM
jgi:hypothetical protein